MKEWKRESSLDSGSLMVLPMAMIGDKFLGNQKRKKKRKNNKRNKKLEQENGRRGKEEKIPSWCPSVGFSWVPWVALEEKGVKKNNNNNKKGKREVGKRYGEWVSHVEK